MKITVLTSSRADYGIYLPLLKQLKAEGVWVNIIAFGTHTHPDYGHTVDHILRDGFEVAHQLHTVMGDSPEQITLSMAKTMELFAPIWQQEKGDTELILCLGDRYEMFASVSASVPFSIPIAHIHGGETTLGAIDNVFRHALTLMATYHFTSAEAHSDKVAQLLGHRTGVYTVGSLSLDNLDEIPLLSTEEFEQKFHLDIKKPTVLVTFHPETVSYEKNEVYADLLCELLETMTDLQVLITLPNADTMGNAIRMRLLALAQRCTQVTAVENLGVQGYFSAMKHCAFLLGNTSSGIIEAASFGKYVINIGDRQKGRTTGDNVWHVPMEKEALQQAVQKAKEAGNYEGKNMYQLPEKASVQIVRIIKGLK